jgi:prepilin-type N-terminal cleavage/methylation domain-containing protein
MLKDRRKDSGFTIVELLVVIVVIGVLAAITVVSYVGITTQANLSSLKSDYAQTITQLELFKTLNGRYPIDSEFKCPATSDSEFCKKSNTTVSVSDDGQSVAASASDGRLVYPTIDATGGDNVVIVDSYKIHQFTSVGDSVFRINGKERAIVEVLVVAGGGGGGASRSGYGGAGGGGGGGLIYKSSFVVGNNTDIIVTVGGGGAGGIVGSTNPTVQGTTGKSGEISRFASLLAYGGGGGGASAPVITNNGLPGGSGGGGGYPNGTGGLIVLPGQGNNGERNYFTSNPPCVAGENCGYAGAGGGGAGGVGGRNLYSTKAGAGGAGVKYMISGNEVEYSKGGNGGGSSDSLIRSYSPNNTGKGGDAYYAANGSPFSGGSGVVIVRYRV